MNRKVPRSPFPEVAEHRRRLLAGLEGRVLEVGAGHGLNFAHYPETVTQVVAVEPEPYLRAQAQAAARKAPVPVEVVAAQAEALPVGEGEFDAAVASLVLCSVHDPDVALAEVQRALRPAGELRFYEHVRSERAGFARAQRAVDLVWPLLVGGCHVTRDTVGAIERAGFRLEELERFDFRPCAVAWPATPHVLGRASRE